MKPIYVTEVRCIKWPEHIHPSRGTSLSTAQSNEILYKSSVKILVDCSLQINSPGDRRQTRSSCKLVIYEHGVLILRCQSCLSLSLSPPLTATHVPQKGRKISTSCMLNATVQMSFGYLNSKWILHFLLPVILIVVFMCSTFFFLTTVVKMWLK